MSSATSTENPDLGGPTAPLLPRWQRLGIGAVLLALWGAALLGLLKAHLRASTVLLFLTGGLLMWTALWLYRSLAALATDRAEAPRSRALGARRRELEREKRILLKAIKELEFDHAMGKLSAADHAEIAGRYRARAIAVLRQLDAGSLSYRDLVERELAARLAEAAAPAAAAAPAPAAAFNGVCRACRTRNDADADFCKKCGARLTAEEAGP